MLYSIAQLFCWQKGRAMDDYIPLEQAAKESGLHIVTLRRLLRKGSILGYKAHRFRGWMVSRRSLDAYTNPVTGFALDLPGPKLFLTRRK